MSKLDFEEKKQARIDSYKRLAEKNKVNSSLSYKAARELGDMIPMGQPILVGHHSEASHRRHIQKIDNNMRASIEADNKAKYYDRRADSAENGSAISSDNPKALDLLREKLASLEKNHQWMVDANKVIRNKKLSEVEKVDYLVTAGITESMADEILHPRYDYIQPGFAAYALSNSKGNIKSVKDRIAQLELLETRTSKEYDINGVTICEDTEDNRVKLFFPGKPDQEVRTKLKRNGFRWSPNNRCWQRNYNDWAIHLAKELASKI